MCKRIVYKNYTNNENKYNRHFENTPLSDLQTKLKCTQVNNIFEKKKQKTSFIECIAHL